MVLDLESMISSGLGHPGPPEKQHKTIGKWCLVRPTWILARPRPLTRGKEAVRSAVRNAVRRRVAVWRAVWNAVRRRVAVRNAVRRRVAVLPCGARRAAP
eukprot:gene12085-biopygen3315